jgi:hypothetical protein
MPRLPFPKRKKDKNKKENSGKEEKMTLASAEGRLRKLSEKDLILESRKGLLRFRLLAKTQFRNKAGEPIRDSLLHPGDELTVQVNPDDEETALRVILMHEGSANDRASAEKPLDESAVRSPNSEDLSKPRTVTIDDTTNEPAPATAQPESTTTPSSPSTSTATPAAEAAPEPISIPPRPRDPKLDTDEQILRDARDAAAAFSAGLPNFVARQSTSRFYSMGDTGQWQPIDVVTAEVSYSGGKEEYHNFEINGRQADRPVEKTGAWSTGDFGSTLEDLLSPATKAAFTRRGEEHVGSRPAWVYDFKVEQPNSHWSLVSPDGRHYNPAYEGTVWVDEDTRRVLRLEQHTLAMPNEFPFRKAESKLEYSYVRIDQKVYLMPASGESTGCMNGSGACTRNVTEYKHYRKFGAESNVKF